MVFAKTYALLFKRVLRVDKVAEVSNPLAGMIEGIQCPGTSTSHGSEGPLMACTMEAATPL